jgi:PAS domain S-box-containing protein
MLENEPGSSKTGVDPERLFAAAPEALFVVRDDRIEVANETAVAFLGCDPAGLEIQEVVVGWVEGADAGVPFEATLRSPAGGELAGEVRVRRLDASRAIVAIRDARALLAGREAEAALTEAEARYRSLVEQIPAVVYADDGEVTTYVSPQIQQILGVSAEAYREDPDMWLRMVHPDDRAMVEAESEAFLAGSGRDLTDYRMVRPTAGSSGSATARSRSATPRVRCSGSTASSST